LGPRFINNITWPGQQNYKYDHGDVDDDENDDDENHGDDFEGADEDK